MTDAVLPAEAEKSAHIVDLLIEERATKLMARPWLWPLVKAVFYPLLGYDHAVHVADEMRGKSGVEAMNWASGFLDMTTDTIDVEHVPATGAVVIVANHPGGIADGIAVWDALRERRPDIVYFANRDALRVSAGLQSVVIPVEWRYEERSREKTRETLRQAIEAFKTGRCIVVFPAGRMAEWRIGWTSLVERPWMSTAVGLARKYKAPIVPLGVAQRLSLAYYTLSHVSEELKNMTVFYELLAKRAAKYRLRFGQAIPPDALPGGDEEATEALRLLCQELAWETE